MSAKELRQGAETLRANPYAALRGDAPSALKDLLERAAAVADEAEHHAAVVSDVAMTHVEPKYSPLLRDLVVIARLINGGAA